MVVATESIYNSIPKTLNIMGQYDVGMNLGTEVELVKFIANIGRVDHLNAYMGGFFTKHRRTETKKSTSSGDKIATKGIGS